MSICYTGKEVTKFDLKFTESNRKGKCSQVISVKGNGVEDTFKLPCEDDLNVINKNGILLIGDLATTPYCVFTDRPGELVVLKDGQCTRKSYTTVEGQIAESSSDLKDNECEQLEDKVNDQL